MNEREKRDNANEDKWGMKVWDVDGLIYFRKNIK